MPLDFYDEYLHDDPPDLTWWVRSLGWQPRRGPEWTFWQYFVGTKAGVEGRVDRNAFSGTIDDLLGLTIDG